jgi:hypothetical protein
MPAVDPISVAVPALLSLLVVVWSVVVLVSVLQEAKPKPAIRAGVSHKAFLKAIVKCRFI